MSDLQIYLLTFNCARNLISPQNFAPHIFDALPQDAALPDILVLSLQELAPIAYSFLGGSFLVPYFAALREAVQLVARAHVHIVTQNIGLTAIMVFAKESSRITSLQTAGVGVGVHGMGNKGAVGVQLTFDNTELAFVAAHLAPMEDAMLRRNQDWENIVKRMVFTPQDTSDENQQEEDVPLLQDTRARNDSRMGLYNPSSHLFVAGDLNYRTSDIKPTSEDFEKFPQPTDKLDSPNYISALLKRDQLNQQLIRAKTLHGFSEPKIEFLPTYKLLPQNSGESSGGQWHWARHRWPSWCDRILYLELPTWMDGEVMIHKYDALPQIDTSDHRPVALSLSVPLRVIPEPPGGQKDIRLHPPFDIDPQWRSQRAVARRKEVAVGLAAYLALTWEGNGLLLATIIGGIGGWLVIRSLLAV